MNRPGPDVINSMDPKALKELINGAKLISKMRGGQKKPAKEEGVTIDFAFASVVSIKNINKGESLSAENIWLKRPSGGDFGPSDYENLFGSIALNDIKSGTQIKKSDID